MRTNISASRLLDSTLPTVCAWAVFLLPLRALGSDAGGGLRRIDNQNAQPRFGSSDETLGKQRLKAREKVGDCISPVSFAIRKITVPASFTIDLELPALIFSGS